MPEVNEIMMDQEEDKITKHESLAVALCHAMMEYEPLEKNHVVNAGSFSYSYADLGHMRRMTDPALLTHGLIVTDKLEQEDDVEYLTTTMTHIYSGETTSTRMDVTESSGDMKKQGANMTYAKRYNYAMLTGRTAEDDEDARPAQRKASTQGQPAGNGKGKPKGKSNRAHGLADKLDMDHDALHNECAERFGVASVSDMTDKQWTEQIAILADRLTERQKSGETESSSDDSDKDGDPSPGENTLPGKVTQVAAARGRSEAEVQNYLSSVYMIEYSSMRGDLADSVYRNLESVLNDTAVAARFDTSTKEFAAWSIVIPGGIDQEGGFKDFMAWLTGVPENHKEAILAKLGVNVNTIIRGAWVRSIPPERFPEWLEVAKSVNEANSIPF
jgi:hypothetical protein